MNCPECGGKLGVIDSRAVAHNSTRRRLECTNCGERFSTLETIIQDGQHSVNAECNKCIAGIFRRLANSAVESGYTSALTGGIYATKEHAVKDSIAELERIFNEQ